MNQTPCREVAISQSAPKRYLFYSHDGVGLGHTCRNLAIARALTHHDPEATILLATGTDDALQLGVPDRVEILKLPGLRKISNGHYAARRLLVSERQIHELRSELLAGAVRSFQPHVLVVDKHPLGVGGELREALCLLQAHGGAAVLGLRDILDDAATVRAEWTAHRLSERIAEYYDRLLIYGQRSIFNPVLEYRLPRGLAARTVFCGYVVNDRILRRKLPHCPQPAALNDRPKVLATVGGGEDGTELLAQFLEASVGAHWSAVAVSGPLAPCGQQDRLRQLAHRAGATLHEFIPSLWDALSETDALVCMGGYNTLSEALSLALPVVCVPREKPRREQLLRAESFARLGLLQCLRPDRLTPGSLRQAIGESLNRCRKDLARRCAAQLRLNGATHAAGLLSTIARERVERLSPRSFSAAAPWWAHAAQLATA